MRARWIALTAVALAACKDNEPSRSTTFIATADLSAEEQLILERLNEVRASPAAFLPHWKAYLKTDTGKPCVEPESMLDPIATYEPRQPLASNQALTIAARNHARDMIDRGYFDHVSPDGVGPNKRVRDAGYALPVGRGLTPRGQAYGAADDANNVESIHFRGSSDAKQQWSPDAWREAIDSLIVDACVPSRGHRDHLLGTSELGALELEVGIGAITGKGSGEWASKMSTAIEIAMRADDTRFVTGVVYNDGNGNERYDYGEGAAGIDVTLEAVSTMTNAGGGYVLPVRRGSKGAVVARGVRIPVDVGEQNLKIDFPGR
jgi:uncharacterized protein YkwD